MSPLMAMQTRDATRFPRVSGDEPGAFKNMNAALGFSPRERG